MESSSRNFWQVDYKVLLPTLFNAGKTYGLASKYWKLYNFLCNDAKREVQLLFHTQFHRTPLLRRFLIYPALLKDYNTF